MINLNLEYMFSFRGCKSTTQVIRDNKGVTIILEKVQLKKLCNNDHKYKGKKASYSSIIASDVFQH